jgi:cobalt-zinc-cadmium efflux system outer membrane protein
MGWFLVKWGVLKCLFLNRTFFLTGLVLAVVVGFLPARVRAQALAGTNGLSLAEARRMAFERNWDLLAARGGLDAAQAQLLVAKEFPNPTFSYSTAKIGSHADSTSLGNGLGSRSYDTIFALNELIEIGGKRQDRQVSARAGVAGAQARFEDARRLLDQGVTKAYLAALLAGENERILKASAGLLNHEVEIGRARLKAGDLSEADEKQIENNADVFELQAAAAAAAAVQARVGVEILLGVERPEGHWEPTDSLAQLAVTTPTSEGGTNAARPDVRAAAADLEQSKADLKLQKAMRIPDPTFTLLAEHNPPDTGPPTDTLGIGVSFPLPLWNWNRGEIKAALATVDKNALALAKARAQAVAEVAIAESEWEEAAARLARYRDQILPKSQQVRESVAFAYEKGGAALVDLLEAERADNDARLATAQAMADTASAAAEVRAARNIFSQSEVTEVTDATEVKASR